MSHKSRAPEIILGSSSKSRQQALEKAGIRFTVELPGINEKDVTKDASYFRPGYIAEAKSEAILKKLAEKHTSRGILVAVDTVVLYGKILREKPEHHTQLLEWVREYGKSRAVIEVVTAMVVTNLSNGKTAADQDLCRIFINPYSEEDAKRIAHCDAFLSAAGGIIPSHELWKSRIDRIEGSPGSADAMPLNLLNDLMRKVA